jgi:chemotaxis methyl-accepting protein methylase
MRASVEDIEIKLLFQAIHACYGYDFWGDDPDLRKNILLATHNLVVDDVFCEAHVILCRNVLIYSDRELQTRVFEICGAPIH